METQMQHITKEMTMGDIIEKYPYASEVMLTYGLHCVGCHVNPYESLENGALGHGMSDDEINSMLQELNDLVKNHSDEPETEVKAETKEGGKVTITGFAAQKVGELMKSSHSHGALRVAVVAGGCSGKTYKMDFDEPKDSDFVFEEHGVTLVIDKKSMEFLDGTQIDYVESLQGAGFKLENPNSTGGCGCGKSVH